MVPRRRCSKGDLPSDWASDSGADVRLCRFCYEGDDLEPLVEPCGCTGSMRYIHLTCLREWLVRMRRERRKRGEGCQRHPATCQVCLQEYRFQLQLPTGLCLHASAKALLYLGTLLLALFVLGGARTLAASVVQHEAAAAGGAGWWGFAAAAAAEAKPPGCGQPDPSGLWRALGEAGVYLRRAMQVDSLLVERCGRYRGETFMHACRGVF